MVLSTTKLNLRTKKYLGLFSLLLLSTLVIAQDPTSGVNALEEINTGIRAYFGPAKNILFAVAAVIALIGAIRVYQKWNNGDQDVNKAAMGWFGSAIFLLAAALAISTLFGVS